jgi:hypothetical protein|tara:strand:- start:63255 stop:64256 length:1002 start_codon:yes stop_codon:yes gene_type:complete
MSEIVYNNFYHGLRAGPDSTREEGTVLDELHWAMQWQKRPIDRTCQTISQFHGPYSGSSPILSKVLNAVKGAENSLQKLARTADEGVHIVTQEIAKVRNIAGLINDVTGANMSTPFLRHFVTECQSLHPDVNAFIQNNINQFPYFQQVSEQIGSHFTIISDVNMISQLFSIECGQLPINNLKTASRMVRLLSSKMFKATAGNMEDSQNFLDTMSMRNMPYEENFGFLNPNYAQGEAMAHGHNCCMDVFHQKRAENAIPKVLENLMNIFGDKLRLLNQIFPVEYRIKHEEKSYDIMVEGESQTVDRLNRSLGRESKIEDLKATEEGKTTDGEGS